MSSAPAKRAVEVRGALVQMGEIGIDRDAWDWDEIARNPFFCPDKDKAAFFEGYLDDIRKKGSSIGAVIEVSAEGVPAGLGAPIYAKLDAELAAALSVVAGAGDVLVGLLALPVAFFVHSRARWSRAAGTHFVAHAARHAM